MAGRAERASAKRKAGHPAPEAPALVHMRIILPRDGIGGMACGGRGGT